MKHITKSFGGTLALNDVSFNVKQGSIHALLGENGAGKSTLIKILAGVYPKDGGEILFQGKVIENAKSMHNTRTISFIHQDLGLIDWMTVAENIGFLAGFPKKHRFLIDWRAMDRRTRTILDTLKVDIDPQERIMNLSRSEQSLVAISRAISNDAKIIFLDEPTASLPAEDVKKLFDVLRTLKEKKVSIVLVSHRLDEVFDVCDDVFILRDGCFVNQCNVSDITEKELVRLIIGKDKEKISTPKRKKYGDTILSVESIKIDDIGPISFTVSRGEVLALSGLRGAGQEEMARVLFGARPRSSGDVYISGDSYHPRSPNDAITAGISLLAKDRIHESICSNLSVAENLFLNPNHHGFSYMYSIKDEIERSSKKTHEYDIRPRNVKLEISSLSGGNQQKTVLARWLDIGTPILILEDPTQGIDIGARIEIYKYIEHIAAEGHGIIIVSTDYEEVVAVSHRALVFSKGDVVKELIGDELTLTNLLYYTSCSTIDTEENV